MEGTQSAEKLFFDPEAQKKQLHIVRSYTVTAISYTKTTLCSEKEKILYFMPFLPNLDKKLSKLQYCDVD